MAKFKIGDRVRLTEDNMGFGDVGDIGIITGIDLRDNANIHFETGNRAGDTWWAADGFFELAPKFAVGDRVRLTEDNGGFGSRGDTGGIRTSPDFVRFDREIRGDTDWYVDQDKMEPVAVAQQSQLTIRAGRYYKTRDGRKVGPVNESGWLYGAPGFYDHEWYNTGRVYSTGEEHDKDLIAEWVYEPADAEPKFKVGDRVHYKDHICEGVGVITEPNGDDDWFVEVEEHDRKWAPFDNMTTRVFDSGDLRLVAPATSGKGDNSTARFTVPLEAYGGDLEDEVDDDFDICGYRDEPEAPTTIADIVRRLEALEAKQPAEPEHNIGDKVTLTATVSGMNKRRVNIVIDGVPSPGRSLAVPAAALRAA